MATITIVPRTESNENAASQNEPALAPSVAETRSPDLRTDQLYAYYIDLAASPERLHQVAVHIAQIREFGNSFEQADADILARKVAAGIIGNTKDIPLAYIILPPAMPYSLDPKFQDLMDLRMNQYAHDIREIIKQGHQSMAIAELVDGAGTGVKQASGELANDGADHAVHMLGMKRDASPARNVLHGVEIIEEAGENIAAQLFRTRKDAEPARTEMLDKLEEIAALPSAAQTMVQQFVDEKRGKIANALFDNQAQELGQMYAEGATKAVAGAAAAKAATALGGVMMGTMAHVMGPIEQALHDYQKSNETLRKLTHSHRDFDSVQEQIEAQRDAIIKMAEEKYQKVLKAGGQDSRLWVEREIRNDDSIPYKGMVSTEAQHDLVSLVECDGFGWAKLDQLTHVSRHTLPGESHEGGLSAAKLRVVTLQGGQKEIYLQHLDYPDFAEKVTVDYALNAINTYQRHHPEQTQQVRDALQREFGLPVDKPGPQSRADNVSEQVEVATAEPLQYDGGVSL